MTSPERANRPLTRRRGSRRLLDEARTTNSVTRTNDSQVGPGRGPSCDLQSLVQRVRDNGRGLIRFRTDRSEELAGFAQLLEMHRHLIDVPCGDTLRHFTRGHGTIRLVPHEFLDCSQHLIISHQRRLYPSVAFVKLTTGDGVTDLPAATRRVKRCGQLSVATGGGV